MNHFMRECPHHLHEAESTTCLGMGLRNGDGDAISVTTAETKTLALLHKLNNDSGLAETSEFQFYQQQNNVVLDNLSIPDFAVDVETQESADRLPHHDRLILDLPDSSK